MLQHTVRPLIKRRCQVCFDRCFVEWKKGKANFSFLFFLSVIRWWTSQAAVFVFAEWWKADGMLLGSTWADVVCAEGHWISPRLLNNVDHSQVHRVKSSHLRLAFSSTLLYIKAVSYPLSSHCALCIKCRPIYTLLNSINTGEFTTFLFKPINFRPLFTTGDWNERETHVKRRDMIVSFKKEKVYSHPACTANSRAQEREKERERGEGEGERKKRESQGGKSSGREGGEGKWRMHL